jgi:lysophospholipase L1-like esterase
MMATACGGDERPPRPAKTVRYVALGDSYTIGEGVDRAERWPERLAAHARRDGVRVEVVANPAVTGYTTKDVLAREIPALRAARADFATLQIGVNDWVRGASAGEFRANLAALLDEIPRHLTDRRAFAVVTIPDFASAPAGVLFTGGRNATAGIRGFNAIIAEESRRRGIPVADVFAISRRARTDPELVGRDGLHPSPEQYEAWEAAIYPVVREVLPP